MSCAIFYILFGPGGGYDGYAELTIGKPACRAKFK